MKGRQFVARMGINLKFAKKKFYFVIFFFFRQQGDQIGQLFTNGATFGGSL